MYCNQCGSVWTDDMKFCFVCGAAKPVEEEQRPPQTGRVGFSEGIHDPSFAQYFKNNNRWSAIFSLILAAAAVIGFFNYGETSHEMENPEALTIGFVIGAMFLLIALFQIAGRKRSKTWDGVVVNKTAKKKYRHQSTGVKTNDNYLRYYTDYEVSIRQNNGNMHAITTEDDRTVYDYYKMGDKVRHHAKLNSYEKYDKSGDSIIFCNACGTLCQITDDTCFRCKCPLLK